VGDFLNPQEEEETNWLPALERADELFQKGLFQKSFELVDGTIREYQNFPILWKARGFIQYGGEQNDTIVKSFVRALDIGDDDYTIYAELGNLLNGIGKYDVAEKSLTAAIQLKNRIISYGVTDDENRYKFRFLKTQVPLDGILLNRAMSRCGLANFDGALKDCSLAEKIDSHNPAIYFSRGVIQHSQGKLSEAVPLFKKSASLGFVPAQEVLKQISK
jgi:tetratricopeptide (TPR) repeat protein